MFRKPKQKRQKFVLAYILLLPNSINQTAKAVWRSKKERGASMAMAKSVTKRLQESKF